MIYIGIIMIAASVGLFFAGRAQDRRIFAIKSVQTGKVKDIEISASDVEKEIGGGSFSEIVALKGVGSCESPLSAELSGTPCLYYTMKVTREYEEQKTVKDSDGNSRTETHRGSETVSSNTRSIPFTLDDSTGKITVDPSGAEFVSEKTFEEFKPEVRQGFSIGSFVFNIGNLSRQSGRTTIGYTFSESAIPLGRNLYVLGEASDSGGKLAVRKPADKGRKFIVSLKGEEDLVKSAGSTSKVMKIISIAAFAVGIAAIIMKILS